MKRNRRAAAESGINVPAYIVTFSDMVTLLLTFFVMLLSLAKEQDPELYNIGRDSFVKSISKCGLGMFYGRKTSTNFGEEKIVIKAIYEDELRHHELMRWLYKTIVKKETLIEEDIWDQMWNDAFTHGTPGG